MIVDAATRYISYFLLANYMKLAERLGQTPHSLLTFQGELPMRTTNSTQEGTFDNYYYSTQ